MSDAHNRANRKYAAKNKEALKAQNLKRRQANPAYNLVAGAKTRARKRGIPFDLTLSDISIPTTCPILGIELRPNYGAVGGCNNSPSIDRIDPNLGYIKENIQIISNLANMMKSNATPEQLKLFANWVLKTYD